MLGKLNLFLLFCLMFKEGLTNENITTATTTTTKETVINDYRNAFKMLANNSIIFNKIIPIIYNVTNDRINTSFTFKLPNEKIENYEMLIMKRSDFEDPIFPNITIPSRLHMSNQVLHLNANLKNEWSVLGLNGWTGELDTPNAELEELHKNDKYYSKDSTLTELINGNVNEPLNDITTLLGLKRTEDVMNMHDVYLARANDPFGFSTKWQLKNIRKAQEQSIEDERTKRGVIKLYSMIKCSTNCEPILYKGYGCYCGFLGSGRAVDGLDRCCKLHDKCYEHSNCISFLQYFVPYVWKCYRGKPLCAIDHGEWGGPVSCASRLCNCDLRLAQCLRQFACPLKRAVCSSSSARRFQNLIYFL